MKAYRLAGPAEDRVLALLDESEGAFGTQGLARYAALLLQAMSDLAENPRRFGTRTEPGIDPSIGFYPIRHSRNRVAKPQGLVQSPRQVSVFRVAGEGLVDILGLIPDVMPADIALPRFIKPG